MKTPIRTRRTVLIYGLSVLLFVGGWWFASTRTIPAFLPSPLDTFKAFGDLIEQKILLQAVGISLLRIYSGWLLGAGLIGIPVGILMGRIRVIREFVTPYVEFFRFIPPIAFVTLSLIWFGVGEMSKIMLITYTSFFICVLNTMAGVIGVKEGVIRAARSMGANELQLLFSVVIPSTIPSIVTGMRVAMGISFGTIVAAEMIAANSGIGYIIWSSRNYMLTDQIFVGIVTLGALGFVSDRTISLIVDKFLRRFRPE